MTWFIESRQPTIATVNSYPNGRSPPSASPIEQRQQFDAETKRKMSKTASVFPHEDGFKQHMLLDQNGYLLLSQAALDVLKSLQSEGWEAIPLKIKSATKEGAESLLGDTYYLLNLYLHRDLVDLERGNIEPKVLHKGRIIETTVYWLDQDHRDVAIKKDQVGETKLWLGKGLVLGNIFFVADPLKEAWCALGVNPVILEPCIDV
ncbi:MAG: hypothetical protein RIC14_06685 [Filomicrobium sp.]